METKNVKKRAKDVKKPYTCTYLNCNKKFTKPSALEYHFRVHTGEKTYICLHEGCEKGYARHAHLKRHEEKCHSPKKPEEPKITHKCLMCEKEFLGSEQLSKHAKRHEKRKFKCDSCPKSFLKLQHLLIHKYEHTGIKPFVCPHEGCEKRFLLPSKLKAHVPCHRSYPCDFPECQVVLATWGDFQKHKKEEHPVAYTCDRCDKIFSTRANRDSHFTTHLELRSTFECPYKDCDRYYYYEKNLRQHVRSVHEKKYFVCLHKGCMKNYLHKKSLMIHMKVHEPGYVPPLTKDKAKVDENDEHELTFEDEVKKLVRSKPDMVYRLSGMIVEDVKEIRKKLKKNGTLFESAPTEEKFPNDNNPVSQNFDEHSLIVPDVLES